jgi:hypothetical protein
MRLGILIVCVFGAACGGGGGGDDDIADDDGVVIGNGTVFDPAITDVVIEVDYETGNEPYTGEILAFGDTWDLTHANLERLFAGGKTLTLPTTLGEMEDIGAVADEEITVDDARGLADVHRALADSDDTRTYYVLFVSGHFADDTGVQSGVLGVSIGNTGIIVMFKDVIESTGLPAVPNLERFVEQSTLVHELGHAVGLVDNGVPLTTAHLDAEHGKHCTNTACVMYWQNEGASAMAEFARQYAVSGDAVLFADDCLADVDAINAR